MKYAVPFAGALDALPRERRCRALEIETANHVDPDLLFALDTELRGDVPGTDGWIGKRSWFDDELRSPEFDEDGYLVGVEARTGRLVGLGRMWRGSDGPALGMLGVVAGHRNGFAAAELLRETLTAPAGGVRRRSRSTPLGRASNDTSTEQEPPRPEAS